MKRSRSRLIRHQIYNFWREKDLKPAAHALFMPSLGRAIPNPTRVPDLDRWEEYWLAAFDERAERQMTPQDLLETGRLLARLAECYTIHEVALRVFAKLRELVSEFDAHELVLADVLAWEGELARRQARMDDAVECCQRALDAIRDNSTPDARKLASRILYELAHLSIHRGHVDTALEHLAQSHAEAERAGDTVGAGIARAIRASLRTEEGVVGEPLETLRHEATHFTALAESDEIKRAGRDMFARRWRVNCDLAIVQALLVSGELEGARRAYTACVEGEPNPSKIGNATLAVLGASIALADGRWSEALALVERARAITPEPFAQQEAAAEIKALSGLVLMAMGDAAGAREEFDLTLRLSAELRNVRGQGWAALGLAVLSIEAGDDAAAVAALEAGKARCARHGAPIRCALARLHEDVLGGRPFPERDWRQVLQSLPGPLPEWLATRADADADAAVDGGANVLDKLLAYPRL